MALFSRGYAVWVLAVWMCLDMGRLRARMARSRKGYLILPGALIEATADGGVMGGKIDYLNTDLDLKSADDLTALAAAFEAAGAPPLHVTREDDGLWYAIFETDYATFETDDAHTEPEQDIAVMVWAVESLPESLRLIWDRCLLREFNIGYDCGDEPWAFNQGLSSELLGRIASIGASLRITLYPYREDRVEPGDSVCQPPE